MAKYFQYKIGNLKGLKRRADKGGGTVPAGEVYDGTMEAMRDLEKICDVRFSTVTGSKDTVIMVKYDARISARGYYTKGLIVLNSYIGSVSEGSKWHGKNQVYKIMSHELGHWLGLGHSNDKRSFMHSNANGSWIQPEVGWLQRKYGIPNHLQADKDVYYTMKTLSKLLKRKYKTKEEQQDVIEKVISRLEELKQ